jgi:hypothetical protein
MHRGRAIRRPHIRYFLKSVLALWEAVMALHSTPLIALVLLLGATVPCFAEETPSRGNPVEGETISGGTMGDILETKYGKK